MLVQTSLAMGVAYGSIALHAGNWLAGGQAEMPGLAAFRLAFFATAAISAMALLGYWRLDPAAGHEVSGQRRK
jgi:hypothetical protein